MEINIFKDKSLRINLPAFIDSRALICANSGGGKSYAVRKILEESNDKVMAIVLDVEGEFKTLREKHNFLLIGDNCDIELNMQSAKLLPEKILETEISTIIDISDLKKSERIKYAKDFIEALMQLKRKLWKPVIVVLDEAHMLCGQQEKQDSCGAVIDLMTRGRKRGFCGVLCTQRISKLHKDAVAEANNIMIGRTGLDIDMKRASEILGFTSKVQMLSLRDLDPGEFFVFGTAMTRYVTKAKIGQVSTVHPRPGMDLRKDIVAPTPEITKILASLNDLPKIEEKKKKELNDYKKESIELKRQIRVLENSNPKPQVDEAALQRAREQGFNEALKAAMKKDVEYKKRIGSLENKINKIAGIIEVPVPEVAPIETVPTQTINVPSQIPIQKTNTKLPIQQEYNDGDIKLGLCEKKLYTLLYQYSDRTFTKPQIGVFTGYSYKSGGFNNAISRLRQLGLIQGSGNNLQALEINPDLTGEFDFSKEAIISKLSKCEKEIYSVLLNNQDDTFGKDELARNTETQYSANSGGFNNAISRLNTLGLIQRSNGMIRLNPELLEL